MLKGILLFAVSVLTATTIQAQDPLLTNWWFNTTNSMYNGILTDVEAVYYTTDDAYIKTSGVPNYYQDGVTVNDASDLNAIWVVPRVPVPASTSVQYPDGGQTGLMLDGSLCFSPGDAQSYNNQGVWNRLAYYFEAVDMDNYNGHSTPDNMYHHHFDNLALNNLGSSVHSPIIGFAWDGYPIYGSYAYANVDGTGGITRMKTSYQKETYTTRTNGPAVGGQYPIGCFTEDWIYINGLGDLDEHNGRFAVTPEYPGGTYAYYTTIDASGNPEYPYFIGPSYHGEFDNVNLGPNGGNATIPGGATQYDPTSVKEVAALEAKFKLYPVPVGDYLNIEPLVNGGYHVTLYDAKGAILVNKQLKSADKVDMRELSYGVYFIQVEDAISHSGFVKRIVKL